MKSLCLQVANAILQSHISDVIQSNCEIKQSSWPRYLKNDLLYREKKAITNNTLSGLSMVTAIAWQLRENELLTFHQLNAAVQKFRESGVLPQPFNEEIPTCQHS